VNKENSNSAVSVKNKKGARLVIEIGHTCGWVLLGEEQDITVTSVLAI
jgi:hypothetical protein